MQVVGVQFDIAWEDKRANYQKVRRMVDDGNVPAGALVVLPEMFATGFSMNAEAVSEPAGGPTEQFLSDLARTREVFLIGGVAVKGKDGRCRNKALTFAPDGRLMGFYAKMRLFSPGEEHLHFAAGGAPMIFKVTGGTVSPFICYDLRFPELFRKATAAAAPDLFVVIANWPDKRIHHWTRLLQARAIENQAYLVGVNRIGSDPQSAYCGRSLIVDPHGEIIADAGSNETLVKAELDLAKLGEYRQRLPFLRDLTA